MTGVLTASEATTARRRWPAALGAGVVYLGISLFLWAHVWLSRDPSHVLTCPCGDVSVQVWWLEWLPRALLHGHDPFYSNAMFARLGGIGAMSNTSWLLPAAVLSPVTLVFGPIASSNVADLLAPVLTGLAAYALAARFTRLGVARFIAGLVFAYSPFVMGNVVLGHVNLTMLAYVPLVLLVGDRVLRGEVSAVRAGVQLGALTVAEGLLGPEGIVITAVLVGFLVVATLLVARDVLVSAWRRLAHATVVGGAIAAVCFGYPVYLFFRGPQHVEGPFWNAPATIPLTRLLFGSGSVHAPLVSTMRSGYEGPRGPGTQFLGVGIVLVVILGAFVARRRRAYAVLAIAAGLCVVVELDPFHFTRLLPIFNDVVPVRLAVGTTLCAGLLLAMVVDGWWRPARSLSTRVRARGGTWASATAALACVAVAVVPVAVTYSGPFTVEHVAVPPWFTEAAPSVPARTPVLVLPFAWATSNAAMVWQAESGQRVALVGGFGYTPGADGRRDALLSTPSDVTLLERLSGGGPLSVPQRQGLRRVLDGWGPLEVVAINGAVRPAVRRTLGRLLGAPDEVDGAATWYVDAPGPRHRAGASR